MRLGEEIHEQTLSIEFMEFTVKETDNKNTNTIVQESKCNKGKG